MKIFIINHKKYVKDILNKLLIYFFWIFIWYLIYLILSQEILVPSPFQVLKRLVHLVATLEFWLILNYTIIRMLIGFLIAVFASLTFAILTSLSYNLSIVINPLIHVIKSTPVISFIVIALILMKSNGVPIFISFLVSFPIMYSCLYQGILQVDLKLLNMSKVFYSSKINILKKVYIPSVLPFFISACSTAIGMAWKAEVTAEVIANTRYSIGEKLYESKIYMDTVDLFAWTISIIFISITMENIVLSVINKCFNKYMNYKIRI